VLDVCPEGPGINKLRHHRSAQTTASPLSERSRVSVSGALGVQPIGSPPEPVVNRTTEKKATAVIWR